MKKKEYLLISSVIILIILKLLYIYSPIWLIFAIPIFAIYYLSSFFVKNPLLLLIAGIVLVTIWLGHDYAEYLFRFSKVPQFSYIDILNIHSKSSYSEYVLIKKVPKDRVELKKMMIDYRDSVGIKLDSIQDFQTDLYCMFFYRYNSTTSFFLKKENYSKSGLMTYESELLTDRKQDHLGTIYSCRCIGDSTKWNTYLWTYYKEYNDSYDFICDTLVYQCRDE